MAQLVHPLIWPSCHRYCCSHHRHCTSSMPTLWHRIWRDKFGVITHHKRARCYLLQYLFTECTKSITNCSLCKIQWELTRHTVSTVVYCKCSTNQFHTFVKLLRRRTTDELIARITPATSHSSPTPFLFHFPNIVIVTFSGQWTSREVT